MMYITNLVSLVRNIRKDAIYKDLIEGRFTRLLELDIPGMIKKFNKGNKDILNTEECNEFINSTITSKDLYFFIKNCERLLASKEVIFKDIKKLENEFRYDPNSRVITYAVGDECIKYYETYQDVLDTIAVAEKVVNSKSTYQLLKLLLKYEDAKYSFKERKEVIDSLKKEDSTRERLLSIIHSKDEEMGIVKITSSKSGISIKAGTRKDMAISDILGIPFPQDEEREGYDYGPYGDFYMPPYSVKKEFYIEGLTPFHEKMIKDEKELRESLRYNYVNEEGYIYRNGIALAITSGELIENGINPESVGWKPFRINLSHKGFFSLKDKYDFRYPIKDQIRLKIKAL